MMTVAMEVILIMLSNGCTKMRLQMRLVRSIEQRGIIMVPNVLHKLCARTAVLDYNALTKTTTRFIMLMNTVLSGVKRP